MVLCIVLVEVWEGTCFFDVEHDQANLSGWAKGTGPEVERSSAGTLTAQVFVRGMLMLAYQGSGLLVQ